MLVPFVYAQVAFPDMLLWLARLVAAVLLRAIWVLVRGSHLAEELGQMWESFAEP